MIPFDERMTNAQADALLRSFPAQSHRQIYASVDVRPALANNTSDELLALLNHGVSAVSLLETDQMVKYFAKIVIGNKRYLRFPGILVLQAEANRFLERPTTSASPTRDALEPTPAAMCQALGELLHLSLLEWTDVAASASVGQGVADCEAAVRSGVVTVSLRRFLTDLARAASATDARKTLDVSALPKRPHATTAGPLESAIVVYMAYLFLWPYVRLVRDIVVEKEKQLTEYLLIMGVRPMALLLSWFALYLSASVLLSVLATALLSDAMFAATPASAASFLLLLVTFASSILLLGVSITPMFSQAKTAAAAASLVYLVLSAGPLIRALVSEDAIDASTALTSVVATLEAISAPVVFMTALRDIMGLDVTTRAVRPIAWSTVRGPCETMALQSVGYLLLGWYLENVFPRTYGVQQRWYFVVQPSYWFPSSPAGANSVDDSVDEQAELLGLGTNALNSEDEDDDSSDATLREMSLRAFVRQFKPALVVQKLSKRYPNGKQALSGVSFGVKKGEIFGLLGPNGAGKSTTLSILCGTLAPTSGDAFVRGARASVRTNPEAIRTSLSVCFQQNILFDDLTVDEHVALVCALKCAIGVETIGSEALDATLAQFGLTEKRDALSKTLSGGQKRKLSLVLALVDHARVVLLDEPTAGMDLHARVATWDALKRAVRHRAVILTTHSMQEAEALCENIGIVADGRLQCCGSSLFLRERYGVGYKLTLVHPDDKAATRRVSTAALVQAVQAFVPCATVVSDNKWETRLQLTDGDERDFAALFRALDAMKAQGEIKRYALAATDLEDVFVRVTAGEGVYHHAKDDVAASKQIEATASYGATLGTDAAQSHAPSWRVAQSQLYALVVKRLKLSVRDKKMLVAQYVWPIALFAILLVAVQHVALDDQSIETLTTLSRSAAASSYLMVAATPALAPRIHAMLAHVDHVVYRDAASASDMVDAILHVDNATAFYAAAYISELDVAGPSDSFAFALLYNQSIPRSLPVALETLSEAHCRVVRPGRACRLTVKTGTLAFQPEPNINSTVASAADADNDNNEDDALALSIEPSEDPTVDLMNRIVLAYYLLFTLSSVVSYYATPVVKERESGLKRQQYLHLAARATSRMYWSAHFAFDYSAYLVATVAIVAVVAVVATSVTSEMLVVWSLGLVLFGAAVLPFTYATSLLFASHSSAQSFLSYASLFQIIATMAIAAMSVTPTLCVKVQTAALVLQCLPFCALGLLILSVATVQFAAERTQCVALSTVTASSSSGQDAAGFVAALSAPAPSVWDWSVSGRYFAALAGSAVAYALVLVVCDHVQMYPTVVASRLQRTWAALARVVCRTSSAAASDYDAVATAADDHSSDLERATHALVDVISVTKVFNRKKSVDTTDDSTEVSSNASGQVVALNDVSFSVERTDCVALLGVNGSGKSTMFEILTGGTAPTRGRALIDNCDVTRAPLDASQRFGYCPQTNVLFSDLTVREHLELFHRLRARTLCTREHERAVVDRLLQRLDLVPVATTAAAHLSGGNKRRLMLALALLSDDVSLLLLDEPSAGVDVVARRLMWRVLHEKRMSSRGTSCLFTTHSMEEAEAVCANAIVLLKGTLVWCGSIPDLKQHASRGVAISLRLDSAVVLAPDRVGAYVNLVDGALGPRMATRHVRPDDLERVWTLCRQHYRPVCAAAGESQAYVPVPNHMRREDWIASVVARTQDALRVSETPSHSATDTMELDEFVKEWLVQEDLAAIEQLLFADVVTRVSGERVSSVDAQTASRSSTTAVYETNCTDACGLAALFDAMEAHKTRFGIAQYSISELSLERVFEQFTSLSPSSSA